VQNLNKLLTLDVGGAVNLARRIALPDLFSVETNIGICCNKLYKQFIENSTESYFTKGYSAALLPPPPQPHSQLTF
jgi:hypothetical protein